jgi:hypothetical protein
MAPSTMSMRPACRKGMRSGLPTCTISSSMFIRRAISRAMSASKPSIWLRSLKVPKGGSVGLMPARRRRVDST